jgi:ribosome-binding factor A
MKARKPLRRHLLALCAEIGPDDGQDPRTLFRKSPAKVRNRKALQLCGQVARTLSSILSGECGDDVLREVIVETVQPVPDASRLLVTVSLAASAGIVEPASVLEHLHRAAGMLRGEVAAAIHRKRAPELTFRLLIPGDPTTNS